jgi:hypothetical protein
MANRFPSECGLYIPGHLTHFIQIRVQADLPRFPATVELLDSETLMIEYSEVSVKLKTHNALQASLDASNSVDGDITYCPGSKLLQLKTSGPKGRIQGSWRPYYLTAHKLPDCAKPSLDVVQLL